MVLTFRAGHPADAPTMAALLSTTWPDDTADAARIARLLTTGSGHVTRVACDDDRLVSFVDAFATTSADGVRRWEVDLLAVDAAYRGQGIARRIIGDSVAAGEAAGADVARALVRVGNVGAERAFAANGFTPDATPQHLMVSDAPAPDAPPLPDGALLIPVETFVYTGVWLEDDHSADAFVAARAARDRLGVDVAGVVTPPDALTMAQACGYAQVNVYRWWLLSL